MGLTESDIRRVAWTFAQTALAAFLVTATGWTVVPNFETAKAAGIAAVLAGVAAAFSLAKNLVLGDGSTLK